MANFIDEKREQELGYEDTNVNVFPFGFLILNDIFGYDRGVKFFNKKVEYDTIFNKQGIDSGNNFNRITTNG